MTEVTVVSVDEYESLLSAAATLEALKEYARKTQGGISREMCAKYLGVEFPNAIKGDEDI